MKIATYQWGGRRCVGLVSQDLAEFTPLALPESQRTDGSLALIRDSSEGGAFPEAAGPRVLLGNTFK